MNPERMLVGMLGVWTWLAALMVLFMIPAVQGTPALWVTISVVVAACLATCGTVLLRLWWEMLK